MRKRGKRPRRARQNGDLHKQTAYVCGCVCVFCLPILVINICRYMCGTCLMKYSHIYIEDYRRTGYDHKSKISNLVNLCDDKIVSVWEWNWMLNYATHGI